MFCFQALVKTGPGKSPTGPVWTAVRSKSVPFKDLDCTAGPSLTPGPDRDWNRTGPDQTGTSWQEFRFLVPFFLFMSMTPRQKCVSYYRDLASTRFLATVQSITLSPSVRQDGSETGQKFLIAEPRYHIFKLDSGGSSLIP